MLLMLLKMVHYATEKADQPDLSMSVGISNAFEKVLRLSLYLLDLNCF